MRFLGTWAVAVACAAVSSVPGCLTSQENPGGRGSVNDPPVTIGKGGKSGKGGSGGTNGLAGEDSGGTSSGRAGRGGGTGNGDGGADAGCSDDADCESRIDDRSRCSVPTGECVRCLSATDCEADEECVNNDCRPILTCVTSEECPHNLVCNPATDRCVQCVGTNGCAAGELCVANTCRQPCTTDSQCIFFGLRCAVGAGYCASCITDDDCPATQNCQAGSCVRDICTGGSARCEGNSVATCNPAGSQLNNPVPCGPRTTCTERGGARCEPWVCQPGTTGCSLTSERVVTCSDDGLRETIEEDCEAQNMLCIGTEGGMCSDVTCEPSTIFCQGNTRQLCDAYGTTSSLVQTCPTNQFCDPRTVTCANPICTPGQPACDGNVFTTCDDEGFGYTGARTDCSTRGESCGPTGCTTSAVDTIPASPALYTGGALSNYAMLNFYSVSSTRNLTLIEAYMSPSSATTLTWLVFESTTQTGTYTNISSTMTTSGTGTGYQASGTLNVPLVAGRFYAIGYSWTSPALLFGFQQTTASQTVSFGALIGAYFPTPPPAAPFLGTSMTTSSFVPQRLTTAP